MFCMFYFRFNISIPSIHNFVNIVLFVLIFVFDYIQIFKTLFLKMAIWIYGSIFKFYLNHFIKWIKDIQAILYYLFIYFLKGSELIYHSFMNITRLYLESVWDISLQTILSIELSWRNAFKFNSVSIAAFHDSYWKKKNFEILFII